MIEYSKPADEAAHLTALRAYARKLSVSEDVAVAIYRQEVQALNADARVDCYIGIIAEKATKDRLRKKVR